MNLHSFYESNKDPEIELLHAEAYAPVRA